MKGVAGELPGEQLVRRGLTDLAAGKESVESLLVSMAATRLRSVGHVVEHPFRDAELRLYKLLAAEHGDGAHSRYNALVRLLVSYQRASCVR